MERAKAIAGKSYCPIPTGVPVLQSLSECERGGELSVDAK